MDHIKIIAGIMGFDGELPTLIVCENLSVDDVKRVACYKSGIKTIYVSKEGVSKSRLVDAGLTKEQAVLAFVAHEFTHHIQFMRGVSGYEEICIAPEERKNNHPLEIDANNAGCRAVKELYGINMTWEDD